MNSLAQNVNTAAITSLPATPLARPEKTIPSMKDLLEDGVYLLFLLRNKNAPTSCAEFNRRIDQYLSTYERVCKTFGKPHEAILDAKYAFCALLDEIVLSSGLPIRDEWEQAPLQLRLFGEHLAGEGFFNKLDQLRQNPAANIELLEIFHTCLLLGFQGKYLLEGSEKLNYLIARLGQEIASVRGPSKGFSPNWKIPLKFNEYVRHELPLWMYYALLAVIGVAFFLFFQWQLNNQMENFPALQTLASTQPAFDQPASELSIPPAQSTASAEAPIDTPANTTTSTGSDTNLNQIEDSQLARDAEARLKRDAESKMNSSANSAASKTSSAVRSAFR
jgi:type VI secretion system protein ImpK